MFRPLLVQFRAVCLPEQTAAPPAVYGHDFINLMRHHTRRPFLNSAPPALVPRYFSRSTVAAARSGAIVTNGGAGR